MKTTINSIVYGLLVLLIVSCAGSKPSSTGSAKTTTQKDYSNYANMFDVLRSIGGITVKQGSSGVEVSIRGSQSITNTNEPLFVLNGVPVGRTFGSISHVNPVNVAEVRVQRSLAATNRWGSEGNSGAILIKTKSQSR